MIAHNRRRVSKVFTAHSDRNAEIDAVTAPSLSTAIDYVANSVQETLSRTDASIAVIGRKRSQIIPYQIVFARRGISFCAAEDLQVFLTDAFQQLKELLLVRGREGTRRPSGEAVQDAMKLCDRVKRYSLSRADRQALQRYLAKAEPHSVAEAVHALRRYEGSLKRKADGSTANAFADAIEGFLASKTVSAALRQVSESFSGLRKDYGKSLEDVFYTDPPFIYLAEYAEPYTNDFFGFIDDVERAVSTLATTPADDEQALDSWSERVHLMTALRAKGKEFDIVVLLDVNDGFWPGKLARTAAKLEQERRLFYVAMTRARHRLVLVTDGSVLGETLLPSPYLAEIGVEPEAMDGGLEWQSALRASG